MALLTVQWFILDLQTLYLKTHVLCIIVKRVKFSSMFDQILKSIKPFEPFFGLVQNLFELLNLNRITMSLKEIYRLDIWF